jgi:Tol biopolymer transport system component
MRVLHPLRSLAVLVLSLAAVSLTAQEATPEAESLPVFDIGVISLDCTVTDADGVETGDVCLLEPDGTLTNLTNSEPGTYAYRGHWNGDGSRLVFYSNRDGREDIYTMAADGSDVQRVTDDETRDYNAAYSPDGTLIAWVSHREDENGDIWIANADGSDARALVPDPARDRTPFFSPDGTQIAFHSYRDDDQAQIFVVDVDGTGLTQLTDGDHPFFAYNADWSPDGTQMLFLSERNNDQADVYVMNADGTGELLLIDDPAPDTLATWSPDGTRILFNSERDGFRQMYIAFADGSGQTPLEPRSIDEGNYFGIRDWYAPAAGE